MHLTKNQRRINATTIAPTVASTTEKWELVIGSATEACNHKPEKYHCGYNGTSGKPEQQKQENPTKP